MFAKIILMPLMVFSSFLRFLKPSSIGRLGRGLGWFLQKVGFRTKIVQKNLALALGKEKSPEELQKLQTQIYQHVGTLFIEIARNFTLTKEDFLRELSVDHRDLEKINQIKNEGRGAIVISAHIANWELFPAGMAARGVPVSIIAKKMSSSVSQKLIEDRRATAGFDVIYAGNTLVKMAAALKQGQFIGCMLDQHMPGKKGLRVHFFDVPAASIRGIATLARETRCRIIPMCIYRQLDGTHRLHVMDEVEYIEAKNLPEGSPERILREEWLNTQKYQMVLEQMIRQQLDQWLWIHRRWKADQTPLNPSTAHLDQN